MFSRFYDRPVQNEVGYDAWLEKHAVTREEVNKDKTIRDNASSMIAIDKVVLASANAKLKAVSAATGIKPENASFAKVMTNLGTAASALDAAKAKIEKANGTVEAYEKMAKSMTAFILNHLDKYDADAMNVLLKMDPDNVPEHMKATVAKLDSEMTRNWKTLSKLRKMAEKQELEAGNAVLQAHVEIKQLTVELSTAKREFQGSWAVRGALADVEDAIASLQMDTANYSAWNAEYRQDLGNLLALESAAAERAIRTRDATKKELDGAQ